MKWTIRSIQLLPLVFLLLLESATVFGDEISQEVVIQFIEDNPIQ